MASNAGSRTGYVVPRYRAAANAAWYHVLHGHVPEHQIDFIYTPEVPQGSLTRTHLGHLARLMRYIEPHPSASHAFAIGNLSRDDTEHEPGHGGVALIFGFRVRGSTDSAGRRDPPFAHAMAAIDRDLGCGALLESTLSLYLRLTDAGGSEDAPGAFYRDYLQCMAERPDAVPELLSRYIAGFDDLPEPAPSAGGLEWLIDGAPPTDRIVIVHPEDEPFGGIAYAAARMAAILYRSNIRWTSIVYGELAEITGGLSIQFAAGGRVDPGQRGRVIPLGALPDGEVELARELFGARPRGCTRRQPLAERHAG